ncbi:MAG: UbiD family decarboxylase domain-containing protein, partial [Acidimicrobiales bacterium]
YLGLGDDELEVAGALMGEGLEVVGCKSVDLFVPAHCEIVIEGAIDATSMLEEGPVSEYSGLYESYGKGPVVTVRHMTMRRDALFQTILPGYGREHIVIGAVAIAAVLERHLGRVFPNLAECTITDGGCGRLHAVVALREAEQGQAEAVIVEGLSALRLVKRLVVVDDDIDVHDPVQVEWAMATRMKADRDLFVFPAMASSRSDPLAVGATVSKLGIDATRRHGDRSDWNRAVPPEAMRLKARLALSRHAGIAANLGAAQDQGVDGRSMSSPST